MKTILTLLLTVLLALPLLAAPGARVVGSGLGSGSPYATDAYPGFDGLDDLPKPEKKTKGWFLSVSRATPEAQFAYAEELEKAASWRTARRAYDALVREWPVSKEAPKAQIRLARIWANQYEDYGEAFDAVEYLLDFYSRDCDYLEMVEYEYQLANLMWKNRRTWFGMSFTSTRIVRQHYESVVRRAPGAAYVPEVMLKIAGLREHDQQYEEAVAVYAALMARFPLVPEARTAAYRQGAARMWLCRRLAYNIPRCRDTVGYLKMTLARFPDLPEAAEMDAWRGEVEAYIAEDDWKRAKFYDTKRRTRHAALTAWETFLTEHPDSPRADEVRARIAELKEGYEK